MFFEPSSDLVKFDKGFVFDIECGKEVFKHPFSHIDDA